MKKIGIIGGLGPEATVDYYNAIINRYKEINDGVLNYPEIIIYSVNMDNFIGKVKSKKYDEAIDYLSVGLNALERAGADFIAISANTPHLFFDELQKRVNTPMISIVEATARKTKSLGLKKVGLIGTLFTMENDFFAKVFEKYSIEIVTPNDEDKEFLNHKLFTEIELGIFKDDTRKEIENRILKMQKESGIEGIILGCTEFPLILKEKEYNGVISLNTTEIHVNEIFDTSRGAPA